jgi:hypothetical protein
MKNEDKPLEVLKILSLIVIAISTAFIALWLSQILQILSVVSDILDGISTSLFDLSNKE